MKFYYRGFAIVPTRGARRPAYFTSGFEFRTLAEAMERIDAACSANGAPLARW